MGTKILVDGSGLAALFAKHPEVEVDLLRNATPQVAELIRRRAEQQAPKLDEAVRQCFNKIEHERNGSYGVPNIVKSVIRDFLKEECVDLAKSAVRQVMQELIAAAVETERQKFTATLDRLNVKEMDAINKYAREAAEREVLALLRAGRVTITEEVTA